jgi:hypothetical protein
MRLSTAMTVLVLAAAAAGCDWREFDDLKKKTPVVSITAPSDYPTKEEFGAILLAVPPPKDHTAAARFVATATHTASAAVVSFDASGAPSGVGVTSSDAIQNLQQGPIKAIGYVPETSQVVMGAPTAAGGDALLMDLETPHPSDQPPHYLIRPFAPLVADPWFGVGVGGGQIGGGAAPEMVVLSSTALHVYVDVVDARATNEKTHASAGAADPCPIEFSSNLDDRDQVNRALIVAPLTGTGTQIAVGSPVKTGVGHVSVFDVDVATGTFTCAAMLTASDLRFGRSMALVDLDGQGGPDHLLVGAPPTHAYLYTLPLSTGQAPAAMVTETGSTGFGTAVAALNIDGTAGDEMFVGDPDADVGGTASAGRVTVYGGAMMKALSSTAFPNPLTEHDPGEGHAYGSAAVAMTFCPANVVASSADGGASADGGVAACTPLPVIGATERVYTYFGLKKPDPRVK